MSVFPKRLSLAAAIATVGALAIPATSSAAVNTQAAGNVLTVTSDDAADTITLAAAGGALVVNGTPTAVPANDDAEINVVAGAGADTVDATALASANYGALNVDGGIGEDLITGGNDADTINGGTGDDRLIGFRGLDTVAGGEGNDTMIWNNGDGRDTNDGQNGNDEVVVNGSPAAGDHIVVAPGVNAGRVQLERLNLITFGIDLSAERLTVNGLGGGDTFGNDGVNPPGVAGRTSVTMNGDSGDDLIIGTDGADALNGGDGGDLMFGGPGDDRVTGDRATDILVGEAGDDTLVWNNGDGSDDVVGGEGFDTAEVNGSPSTETGDDFRLEPNGADAVFRRANLVPFTLDLTPDTEAVAVNGGPGNEDISVNPGLGHMFVVANGGSGNDNFFGSEEADTFLGGSGNDLAEPGTGSDFVDGGTDDDRMFMRDETADLTRGGPGADTAETDSVLVDPTSEVETVDATPIPEPPEEPAPDTKALLPEVGGPAVTRKGRKLTARVPLTCPAAEAGGCQATVMLETARAIRLGPVRAPLLLGTGTADLEPGQSATVRVRLARGTAGLAKRGKLAARLRVFSADAAGNLVAGRAVVDLRIPKR